jgi:hypothetical protein
MTTPCSEDRVGSLAPLPRRPHHVDDAALREAGRDVDEELGDPSRGDRLEVCADRLLDPRANERLARVEDRPHQLDEVDQAPFGALLRASAACRSGVAEDQAEPRVRPLAGRRGTGREDTTAAERLDGVSRREHRRDGQEEQRRRASSRRRPHRRSRRSVPARAPSTDRPPWLPRPARARRREPRARVRRGPRARR